MKLVETAIANARLTLSVLMFLMLAGTLAYVSIPKEAEPDIQIPVLYVSMGYRGISPEDSERLLLRPMETSLKSISGIKKLTSTAYQGGGNVVIEFQAGADLAKALEDVRNKVAQARPELPDGADEPSVHEINLSEFPILVITLSGDVPERALAKAGRELRDRIEELPSVLDADLQGVRDDLVEVVIDPGKLATYGLRPDILIAGFTAGNQLVAAGSLEGEEGRYAIKVPSLLETAEDVANLPVVTTDTATVRVRDIAEIRPTLKEPESIARLDGAPAVAIEVSKRSGANLIETVDQVKAVAEAFKELLPEGTVISFSQDKSKDIRQLLFDLQNSVLSAVILVFIVILYALSVRASLLIGLAIPASFLMGMLLLSLWGFTVNIVVLFSLILAVGMLVDDAIIVTEYAERRMNEGMHRREAFALASHKMTGPVVAATMTRVAAFSPLLFWPGIMGEFMKYLPITLIVTLSASMLYALIFVPTLGAIIARPFKHPPQKKDGAYMWVVGRAVRHPWLTLLVAIGILVAVPYTYAYKGNGVEFFPDVEPDFGLLYVKARGNLSIAEQDALVAEAEKRILGWPGIATVYARTGAGGGVGNEVAPDVIGTIQYEFVDWRERKNANAILADLREAMVGIPGVDIEVSVPQAGPSSGKAIQIQLSADDPAFLNEVAIRVADKLATVPGVIDVSNGLPPPGVDWELQVDRAAAARYGVAPSTVGGMVQLVTSGLKLSDYRPAGADEPVDIVLRLPEELRTIAALDQLRIQTEGGSVPISNFVTRVAVPTTGTLTRLDGARTITVSGSVVEGMASDKIFAQITTEMNTAQLDQYGIRWKLAGEDEEQAEASAFLMKAGAAAVFLIFAVLLAQFNSFRAVGLVLSAILMSTIGVFLGLLIMGQPFSVVMTGIGVIALAGVVVNNNIVLIDTFVTLRQDGMKKIDAVLETCRERARPVVLTALTAILGVLPIAFGLNLELLHHEVTIGAPSTQWWIALSSAIVYGLAFATGLTLIVIPSLLMLVTTADHPKPWFWQRQKRREWYALYGKRSRAATPAE